MQSYQHEMKEITRVTVLSWVSVICCLFDVQDGEISESSGESQQFHDIAQFDSFT